MGEKNDRPSVFKGQVVVAPLASEKTMNAKSQNKCREHEELLTTEEVAARLKVGGRTVERWQQDGTLPFLRLGQTVRFHWPTVVSHLLANFTVCRLRPATPVVASPLVKGGGR